MKLKLLKVKEYLFLLLFGFAFVNLNAQLEQTAFIENHKINSADSNKLYFSVVNRNIIKNSDYYNHVVEGNTLLGSQAFFRIKYYPTENTMFEGGFYLLYYYGMNKLQNVLPLITFSYTPVKGLYFIIGNINGPLSHNLPEPMFKFERFMEDPPEVGAQLLYDNRWVHVDVFLNWRYFLLPDDYDHKEKFTGGVTSYVNLINPDKRVQAQLHFQLLYNHKGGQVDTLKQPYITIQNALLGLRLGYKLSGFFNKVGANFYYLTYNDISAHKRQVFDNGYGLMPEVYARSKFLNLHAGYWKGYDYIAPLGQALFSSVSYRTDYKGVTFPEREMFYFKTDFHHKIHKGIFIGLRYEGYLDLLGNIDGPDDGHFDFSYSVYLNFSRDFFLLKTK